MSYDQLAIFQIFQVRVQRVIAPAKIMLTNFLPSSQLPNIQQCQKAPIRPIMLMKNKKSIFQV